MATSQYPNINEDQFAGLLQVATAAADAQERRASALGKRKRDDEAFIDHQLRTPTHDLANHDDEANNSPILQSSAAVLFREPSEKSKKYSRPPLGKVYTDLELAPEMFLQLQSAAKDFMLDPQYPERKGVVGQKKQNSNNNDVAKLKLWNCVEQFLSTHDEKTGDMNADFYFGQNAGAGIPNRPPRTFFWPDDRDQVIKTCMPLFRKMVTNERQRVYASETRKMDPRKVEGANRADSMQDGMDSVSINGHYQQSRSAGSNKIPNAEQSNMFLLQTTQQSPKRTSEVMLHVNVVAKSIPGSTPTPAERLAPRISFPATSIRSLKSLLSEVQKRYDLTQHQHHPQQNQYDASAEPGSADASTSPTIKVWLSQGLTSVDGDRAWSVALLEVETIEWMDGQLRVLIEI